jgi:hypothetical protein
VVGVEVEVVVGEVVEEAEDEKEEDEKEEEEAYSGGEGVHAGRRCAAV